MAQGLVKSKSKTGSSTKTTTRSSNTTRNGITKKGSLKFNPKKTNLIKAAKINKKFTAGLTAQTEKMLGEKAGHLEMLGHGRKKKTGVSTMTTNHNNNKNKTTTTSKNNNNNK